jgi:hypothetical protein
MCEFLQRNSIGSEQNASKQGMTEDRKIIPAYFKEAREGQWISPKSISARAN